MTSDQLLKQEIKWLLNEKYAKKLTKRAKIDIIRLKKREPLAYLIGNVPFLNCVIDLKYKPLIPRPETEHWTEQAIQDIKQEKTRDIKCLDVFAGSGCIGIAILRNLKHAKVDFVDIKQGNLKQININLKLNNISPERYNVIESDIFQNIKCQHTYDYILANPPYIATKEKKMIQKSMIKHEPQEALFAGKDGLMYIKRFLKEGKNYLKKNGKIYMEFGVKQKKPIENIIKKNNYPNYEFYKDQYRKWRYVILTLLDP